MSEQLPNESVWTAAPNAEFATLKCLPHEPPSAESAAAFEREAREEVEARAEAYRTPVTAETLRRNIP